MSADEQTRDKLSVCVLGCKVNGIAGRQPMAVHPMISSRSFGPDIIATMAAAYELALTSLGTVDPHNPVTELVAKSIINVTATGERDPQKIMERALQALGVHRIAA
jgi:hypothetical protein